MTTASADLIQFPRSLVRPRPQRRIDAEQIIVQAICERRLMSIIYSGAVEPQPFAPYVLYFDAAQRVHLGGCEMTKKRTRWRDLEVAHIRNIAVSDRRFAPGGLFSSKPSHYPHEFISAVDVSR
jgi:hypothetical protein